MRSSRTWKRTLTGIMAAGLVIAACGSDDGGSDSTDPATEASEVVDSVETEASEVVDSVETADSEVADSVEDDAETASSEVDDAEETASTDAAGGEELAIEGQVEVARVGNPTRAEHAREHRVQPGRQRRRVPGDRTAADAPRDPKVKRSRQASRNKSRRWARERASRSSTLSVRRAVSG